MTAESYAEMLWALMPPGQLFARSDESRIGQVLLAIAEEMARIGAKIEGLLDESDPRTALEYLADWERAVGLPDGCAPAVASIEARRARAAQRLVTLGSLTPAFIISQVQAALGIVVEIVEYVPGASGWWEPGIPTVPSWGGWWFDVISDAVTAIYATMGSTVMGQPLGALQNEQIECVIDRLKPAHTNYRLVQN